jgi:hypothetical protein
MDEFCCVQENPMKKKPISLLGGKDRPGLIKQMMNPLVKFRAVSIDKRRERAKVGYDWKRDKSLEERDADS